MSVRDDIISSAQNWADPGIYKPTADELIGFFSDAKTEQVPTDDEAQKSLDTLGTGCYIGGQGQVRHWCGIFACAVARNAGLNSIRWTLLGGNILGVQVQKVWGNAGIQAGDIAIISSYSHHFIVTDVSSDPYSTVEGNTPGQSIRTRTRAASEIVAYYRILGS